MMIIRRIFNGLLIGLIVLAAGLLLSIHLFARNTLQDKLSAVFNRPVIIAGVSYHFPFGLKLSQFSVGDFVSIDRVYLQVKPATIFGDTIRLTQFDLINPVLVLQDRELSWTGNGGVPAAGETEAEPEPEAEDVAEEAGSGPRRLYDIGRVNVINGRLNIVQSQGKPPLKVELTNVRGRFNAVAVPWRARRMPFRFEANAGMNILRSRLTSRPAIGKGWIDPRRQRLEGELFLQDPNGADQMNMTLLIGDNQLSVDGNLHTDLAATPEPRTEGEVWDQIARPVVQQLTDGQGVRFDTKFSVRDRLDEFRLDTMVIAFEGVAFQPDDPEKKVLPDE